MQELCGNDAMSGDWHEAVESHGRKNPSIRTLPTRDEKAPLHRPFVPQLTYIVADRSNPQAVMIPGEAAIQVGSWCALTTVPTFALFNAQFPFSVKVFGEVTGDPDVASSERAATELWYARVTGFRGDKSVPDKRSLDADDYGIHAIALTVLWFYQAKEVWIQLAAQPASDVVDQMIAALGDDDYVVGTVEDNITWGTVNSMGTVPCPLAEADTL